MRTAKKLLHTFVAASTVFYSVAGALLAVPSTASAQSVGMPTSIGYQGRLKNSSGQAISSGTYDFRFRLFDSSDATATSDYIYVNDVTVTSGYFTAPIPLGSDIADVRFDLELEVGVVLSSGAGASGAGLYETASSRITVYKNPYAVFSEAIVNSSADPATGFNGRTYFDTDEGKVKFYDGDAWVTIDAMTEGTTLTVDNSSATTLNVGTGAVAKNVTVGNGTGTSSVTLNAGTGGVAIGTNSIAHLINIGNTTTTSSVTINSGTGDIALESQDDINIGVSAVAQDITLGNSTGATSITLNSGTGAINVGTNAVAHTISIGNATGATAVNTTSGTGGIALLTTTTGALSLTTGTTGAVTLDSGTTGAVNVGTGAAAKTITLGNAASTEAEINGLLVDINGGTSGVMIDGAAASQFVTSSGALTLTSAAAATWSTAAGNLTVKASADTANLTLSAGVPLPTATADGDDVEILAADDLLMKSTDAVGINATGALALSTTSGTISLSAAGGVSNNVDIASTQGSVTLNTANAGQNIKIGTTGVTRNIAIGGADASAADTITMGTSGSDTITVGNNDASATLTLVGGDDWNMSSTGVLTMSASAAATTALVVTDTDYTNALSIGDNNIVGTTAAIDFTGFDVAATTGATVIAGSAEGTNALTLTAGDVRLTDGDLVITSGDIDAAGFDVVVTTGATTIAGAADGTDALTLTLGDILVSNGDVDVSGGDFNVTLDPGDGASISNSAATADSLTVTNVGVGSDGQTIAFTQSDDADATDTTAGLRLSATSSSGDADIFQALAIDNLTGGTATETAISIGTGWDVGLALGSSLQLNDDTEVTFGTSSDADFLWETADGDANAMILALPEGGVTNVPVFLMGDQSIKNTDLTFFNGITAPTFAVISADAGDYTSLSVSDAGIATLTSNTAGINLNGGGSGNIVLNIAGVTANAGEDGDDIAMEADDDVLVAADDEIDLTSSAALDLNSGAGTWDASTLSLDSTDTTNLTMTANDAGTKTMTLSATNAGAGVADMAVTVDGGMTLDSVNALELNSSAGAINIGNDAVAQNINIGTGAAARTLTLGEITTLTEVQIDGLLLDFNAGATGMTLDSAGGLSLDAATASNFTTAAGALTLNGNGGVNIVGNAAEIDLTSSAALDLNSGAGTWDASTLSLDSTDTTNLTMTANDAGTKTMTLSATNAGAGVADMAITVDGGMTLDSVNALELNSSAGAINIGNDAVAQNINIGTGAAARTLTLGEITTLTEVQIDGLLLDFNAGATGMTLDSAGGLSLDAATASNFTTAAGALTLNGNGGVNIVGNAAEIDLTSSAALDLNSGAGTWDASTLSLDSTDTTNLTMTANDAGTKTMTLSATNAGAGVADMAVTVDGGMTLDSVNALELNSSAGAINIGNDAVAQNINIGTGAAARTLTLGEITTLTEVQIDGLLLDFNAGATGMTLDSAGGLSLDAATASNFTTAAGALTLNGNGGVNIVGNAAEIDLTSSAALDLNSGAGTWDASTLSLDSTDTTNLTMTANDAGTKTMTLSATNAGAGVADMAVTVDGGLILGDEATGTNVATVAIFSSDWEISSTGVMTGLGDITSNGDLTITGGDLIGKNGESLDIGDVTDNAFTFARGNSGVVTLTSADDDTTADLTIVAGGTANLSIGDSGDTVAITGADVNVAMIDGASFNVDGDTSPTADLVTIGSGDTTATTGVDGLFVTLAVADGADLVNSGINVSMSAAGTSGTDIVRGLYIDLAAENGGTEKAIEIENTVAWNIDLELQNDLRVVNTSTSDLDLTDNAITANFDFGEVAGSTLTFGTTSTDTALSLVANGTGDIFVDTDSNSQLILNGGGDGVDSLVLTDGDILVTDGDLDLSGGDFNVILDAGDVVTVTSTATTNTAGSIDVNTTSGASGASSANFSFTSVDDAGNDAFSGMIITTSTVDDVATDDNDRVTGLQVDVIELDVGNSGAVGIIAAKAPGTATGVTTMSAGIVIRNDDTDADAGGADTAGVMTNGILFSDAADTEGAITNGINFGGTNMATILTTDIVLQNGEQIQNNVDGAITLEDGGGTDIINGSTAVFQINLDDTNINNGQRLCHGGANAATGIVTISDCTGTSADTDFAEMFPTSSDVGYGDIVAAGTKMVDTLYGVTMTQAIKTSGAYQSNAIGVVRKDNNDDVSVIGYNSVGAEENPLPVALAGRVPVNVTNEGGVIVPGDYIVTSSTAGHGMKATQAGRVIGMALGSFDGVQGQVMVQMMNFWYQPTALQGGSSELVSLSGDVSIANATFSGSVTIAEHLYGSQDMAGRVRLASGKESVDVTFETPYKHLPIITFSSRSNSDSAEGAWISNESVSGFTINRPNSSAQVEFNWIAVGVEDAQVTVSDDNFNGINISVNDPNPPSAPAPVVTEEVSAPAPDNEVVVEPQAQEPEADVTPVVEEKLVE